MAICYKETIVVGQFETETDTVLAYKLEVKKFELVVEELSQVKRWFCGYVQVPQISNVYFVGGENECPLMGEDYEFLAVNDGVLNRSETIELTWLKDGKYGFDTGHDYNENLEVQDVIKLTKKLASSLAIYDNNGDETIFDEDQ